MTASAYTSSGRVFIPEHEKDIVYFSNSDENCLQLFYEVIARAPEFIQNTLAWKCIDTDPDAFVALHRLPCWNAEVRPGVPTLVVQRPGAERGIYLGSVNVAAMLRQRIGRR